MIAKQTFNSRSCHFESLSEDEQAELIKLAILEDKSTREDLLSNLQHLLENGLEKHEEQEEAGQGHKYHDLKQWAISTQLI